MATTLTIAGIAGSLRQASFNRSLLRAAADLVPEGATIDIIEIGDLPLYNLDNDGPHAEVPSVVQAFRSRLKAADALLIATPEYNYSVPGVLKNAIDWASRPVQDSALNAKPTAIMGAGGRFGTVRAQLHLRQIGVFTNLLILNKPEVMIPAPWEKFDSELNLVDEEARKQVAELVAALVAWTRRLQRG